MGNCGPSDVSSDHISEIVNQLEVAWDSPGSFLGLLRNGIIDNDALERLLVLVRQIAVGKDKMIDRRLVALLWFMPAFVYMQSDKVTAKGGDVGAVDDAARRIQDVLCDILGLP
jgi:hypothetical protein